MNPIEITLRRPGDNKTHLRADIRCKWTPFSLQGELSCTLLSIYMTFKLNINCLRQHPATSNHLEITKIEWREASDPIVITAHSLRQLQPGNWKILIKPGTEEQANLLSALREFTKYPQFKNTHPLTRHLVKGLIRQCQPSTSNDQATSPKRNKTNYD